MTTLENRFDGFSKLAIALDECSVAIQRYIETLNSPAVRRLIHERELGYRIPDWVWDVEEKIRRTEGSGNGRSMRD